ncbi:MAG: molybdopterin-binding protein [Arcanobacterium sp.]|nr:molybdopterin-binding protein [Arcanobacterium sp.]
MSVALGKEHEVKIQIALIAVEDEATEVLSALSAHAQSVFLAAGHEIIYEAATIDNVGNISESVQTAAICGANFILTIGGVGISPKDYTARAMDPLLRFDVPGISEAIRAAGRKRNDLRALLNRGRSGVLVSGSQRVLVVNVDSYPEALEDALSVLIPLLPTAMREIA